MQSPKDLYTQMCDEQMCDEQMCDDTIVSVPVAEGGRGVNSKSITEILNMYGIQCNMGNRIIHPVL